MTLGAAELQQLDLKLNQKLKVIEVAANRIATLFSAARRADTKLNLAVSTMKKRAPLTTTQNELVKKYRSIISRLRNSASKLDQETKTAIIKIKAAVKTNSQLQSGASKALGVLGAARSAGGLPLDD